MRASIVVLFLSALRRCYSFQGASTLTRSHRSLKSLVPPEPVPNSRTSHYHLLHHQTRTFLLSSSSSQRRLDDNTTTNKNFGWISSCWKSRTTWMSRFRKFRKRLLSLTLSLMLVWACSLGMPATAKSGYRTGGSFKSSSSSYSRPSYSRPAPQKSSFKSYSSSSMYQPERVHVVGGAPRVSVYHNPMPRGVVYVRSPERVATSFSLGDTLVLGGTGALITYGFLKNAGKHDRRYDDMQSGPLGPGATASSITVAVNVPDRDDPMCILNRLKNIAEMVDTSTRQGVQYLLAEGEIFLMTAIGQRSKIQ